MIFGIDLGTTNSLIGVGDTLLSGLISSSVDVESKKSVGRELVNKNIVSSYKTNMSIGNEGELSIRCSAIILKHLAKIGEKRYGEPVQDVVISVPAYFSTSQREAVYKAAELVELNVKALLNEPTAAALYLCRNKKELIVVYDLGGGTFDVSIVDSRLGNYSVIATDGIVLGGDDLDQMIVEDAIAACKIPMRYRSKENLNCLKVKMRSLKEEIQKTHNSCCVELKDFGGKDIYQLTVERYKELVEKTFAATIHKTNFLVASYVPSCETPKIVYVGGSTRCPYLHEILQREVGLEEVACDLNSDLVVAKGVALYAELLHKGEIESVVEDVTKRLCIEDSAGRSITIIEENSIVPCQSTVTVNNSKAGDKLRLRLYQGSELLAVKNDYVGTLLYDYGREVEQNEGVVEVTVTVSANGVISLKACEVLFGDEYAQEIELTSR